jgi:hypothetical protein
MLPSDLSNSFGVLLELVRSTATAIQNDSEILKGFFSWTSVTDLQLMLILCLVFNHEGGNFSAEFHPLPSMLEGAITKAVLAANASSLELANDFVAGVLSEHLSRGYSNKGVIFLICLLTVADEGKFAITATGRLCLMIADVKPGGKIAIILGCQTPHLLREDGDGFLKIGETYIRGLMHGEALDNERYSLQEILIH